ncbi:RNA deprotection pyrophosphohydrolase [Cytobacillus sp. NCCP-133]|uniref:RNA deprotection pyrophosphohydrolase n=1 Tax=Cytobacillus sp. NCCP-133 TaxID=766848 RepID=UPI00222E08FA|nr:nucleoside triphosphatase YtkD [Cytobacillus sp. NCCP-133]GLB58600.1 putative 8-oxo-dGTP diphosphatase YtkD [Cytobacillus sp. NCCP-133]
METFLDANGGEVRLSFKKGAFSDDPKHVLVICRYNGRWLLTHHKVRGWEFPGGKAEPGEEIEEAARREVYEETGAILKSLEFIGEYEVHADNRSFVKAIFYGEAGKLEKKPQYYETNGPVLLEGNLIQQRWDKKFSFIMKDLVVEKSLEKILEGK